MPMTKTITQHDVLQYIYNDLSLKDSTRVEKTIIEDQNIALAFHELQKAKFLLNELEYEPSKGSIENILNYSKTKQIVT